MHKIMSKQSEEVRKYFIINHIKQVEVAEKINLDKTTLSNILAGRRKFNEEIATALADAYGFDVAYLLTGRGSLVPSRPSRSAGDINNSTVTQGDNSPINIVADNAALEAENQRLREEVKWLRQMLENASRVQAQ